MRKHIRTLTYTLLIVMEFSFVLMYCCAKDEKTTVVTPVVSTTNVNFKALANNNCLPHFTSYKETGFTVIFVKD